MVVPKKNKLNLLGYVDVLKNIILIDIYLLSSINMNINEININLAQEIKKRTAGSVIDVLAEILPLSKEAIYRRLRGDVSFSYPEVVLISKKLQISLDEINFNNIDYFTFNIANQIDISSTDLYNKIYSYGINYLIDNINNDISHFCLTGTRIPISLIGNYEYLSKFRFLKWMYENRGLQIYRSKLSEIIISEKSSSLLLEFTTMLRQIKSTFILNDMMFEHYMKDVKHFVSLGLIDKTDVDLIKQDLHKLTYEFETMVASGKYKDGAQVSVYLTDINIDSTFGYVEKGKADFTYTKIFGMNYALSKSLHMLEMYKNAFEDLKDYATMISQSGSAKRTAFFNKQHQIIDEIL